MKRQTINIDITNLYETKGKTGIQRVVREIAQRFAKKSERLELRLLNFNRQSHQFEVFAKADFRLFLSGATDTMRVADHISISDLGGRDIFFDIDAVWNVTLKRSYLYEQLHNQNVQIVNMVYDLVPIKFPHYTHPNTLRNFLTYISAVYAYSDLVICDSRSAERDFLAYQTTLEVDRYIPTIVAKLGADFSENSAAAKSDSDVMVDELTDKQYLLFVGTLEPRKNQPLLLESFDKLSTTHPELQLVFVGKAGWLNDKFISKLKSHPLYGKRIHWLQALSDSGLEKLYHHSFLNVYLSNYEGYGLPIAESLARGKPIITSHNSSMYEAGLDFADYVRYGSENELTSLISLYLDDVQFYQLKTQKIKRYHQPITWQETFEIVSNAVDESRQHLTIGNRQTWQHVCISIRPDDFRRLVKQTDKYVDVVKEYIVVTRSDLIPQYSAVKSSHKIIVIDEKDLLGSAYRDFQSKSHVQKNWLLRAALPDLKILEDEYIMLDDDNLPIKTINRDYFVKDGRYRCYYYTDLLSQKRSVASYDEGQYQMAELLQKHNFQLLCYSSHAPQIINKKLFKEMLAYFAPYIKDDTQVDEWSMYFNYATTNYPLYFEKRLTEALNWPSHPSNWQFTYVPQQYSYENFYDHIYSRGFFKGLDLNSPIEQKLAIKRVQYSQALKTQDLMKVAIACCIKHNMVHGLLDFEGPQEERVLLASLPYLLASVAGVSYRIEVNYKIINPVAGAHYEVVVESSGGAATATPLQVVTAYNIAGYEEGVVELIMPAVKSGLTKLHYRLLRDGIELLPPTGHYASYVLGCSPGEAFDSRLTKISLGRFRRLAG